MAGALLPLLLAAWAGLPALAAPPPEASGVPKAPKVKAPVFPLEPGKRASRPTGADRPIAGLGAPPAATVDESGNGGRAYGADEWRGLLELGWFLASQSGRHDLSASSGTSLVARRTNANFLDAELRGAARPPRSAGWLQALELTAQASWSQGQADISSDNAAVANARISVQDLRVRAGPGAVVLGGDSPHELALRAEIELSLSDGATIDPTGAAITLERRTVIAAGPRLAYSYSGGGSWRGEAGVGYLPSLSATGDQGSAGTGFRRLEGEARVVRYLAPGQGLAIGALYSLEEASWASATVSNRARTEDIRLSLLWRQEL